MADHAARAAADAIGVRSRALSGAGATDPPYAPVRERFAGYPHREIWERVHEQLDPAALGRTATGWQGAADALGEAFQSFADATAPLFARWSGQSAATAAAATREFTAAGTAASDVCRTIQRLLELNAEAAQTVRAAIVPPPEYLALPDPVAEAVHGGRRRMEYEVLAATALADAQDTMTHVYTPTMPATGDAVPRFAAPPAGPGGAR
ncbi:PPE domain-containing protein [Nocardia jiangsuensis]|uniref:PPE domain-containing protein n=1 Tax=Nocardia jiangsuensis TaxID=1691563 RepID=A0ABV8DT77_9NOCA